MRPFMSKNKISEQEIVWVKNQLKYVGRLEKTLKDDIGNKGFRKLAKSNTSVKVFFGISLLITLVSMFLYYFSKSIILLSPCLIFVFFYFFYSSKVKSISKMNVFEIITNFKIDSLDLIPVIEEFIFSNINAFEDMIIWHNQYYPKYEGKIDSIINPASWNKPSTARTTCNYVALLMNSLQRTLKSNLKLYESASKKGISGLFEVNQDKVNKSTFNNLPKPSIKPLFVKNDNCLTGASNSGAKTQGLFPAANKPILGQNNTNN